MESSQMGMNYIADHPSDFVGPTVAGALFQAIETGIIINQSFRFWPRGPSEHWTVRAIVVFVTHVALFQTAIAFYSVWRLTVLEFGNWQATIDLQWCEKIQPALNCIMAAPVQSFLIWRCWKAMHRKWYILLPLALTLVTTVIVNLFITVRLFDSPLDGLVGGTNHAPFGFVTAFVLSAFLDIVLTSLMLWFLTKAKTHAVSRRFNKIVSRLHIMLWEAAVPPCVCAIAACILYSTTSLTSLWDLFCQSIIGKLFVISLLATLNGRADLRDLPLSSYQRGAGIAGYWMSGFEFRVTLSSDSPDANRSSVHRVSQPQRTVLSTQSVPYPIGEETDSRRSTSTCDHDLEKGKTVDRADPDLSSQDPSEGDIPAQ